MYCNQKPKLSDKEWMESVISQMGFKTKRIDEQQPAAQQQLPATPPQAQKPAAPAAPAAAPSKTMTDFIATINSMSKMLGGKDAMPTDQKQVQAFNDSLAVLVKSFPALQAEMKKPAPAAAPQAQQPAAQQPQQAQAQQPAQQPQQAQAQQPQR